MTYVEKKTGYRLGGGRQDKAIDELGDILSVCWIK